MTTQEATLYAAAAAAIVSLITLLFTSRSARATELRGAQRALLATIYSELGALLYELVALSKKMTQMKTDETFDSVRKQADKTAQRIDELRRKTRYALWGIDDGFRTIQWMPVYISHHKTSRTDSRPAMIIKLGTSLRKSMDAAIMQSYVYGRPPSFRRRAIVWAKARRLRKYFDEGKPT